ncbi:hypothetical protein BM221_006911 [Beauveria bassiana]|uniref:Uncharacterized protein n=1 Tax=Beauveria bassiana TaxID=176275 RepID=A0A2N6NIZ1_BEABA|nr:hypothetical protein BM221_006911 [Beauveria bassiana]
MDKSRDDTKRRTKAGVAISRPWGVYWNLEKAAQRCGLAAWLADMGLGNDVAWDAYNDLKVTRQGNDEVDQFSEELGRGDGKRSKRTQEDGGRVKAKTTLEAVNRPRRKRKPDRARNEALVVGVEGREEQEAQSRAAACGACRGETGPNKACLLRAEEQEPSHAGEDRDSVGSG